MCKLIAELVGTDEQVVGEVISRLEHASGTPGIDLHLTSDIYSQVNLRLKALGLDPKDTTDKELYHGLVNLAERHDRYLMHHYGIDSGSTSTQILEQTTHIMNRLKLDRQAWLLKIPAARRILQHNPPKQLLKLLHYRSVDSLLKRESPSALIAMATRVESGAWLKRLYKQYKELSPLDFEIRPLEIEFLPAKRWREVATIIASKYHTHVVTTLEMGSVFVLPLDTRKVKGLTLLTSLLTLKSIHEVRLHSTYLKLHQVQANFGQLVVDTLYGGKHDHVTIFGQPVHWRVLHKYYGSSQRHPELFSPHIQAEDLSYRSAESILYRLEPALQFWDKLDYVGLVRSDGPISFNLIDIVFNLVNDLPYEKRITYHLREGLWDELYGRYLAQSHIESHVLEQLDERLVGPEAFDMTMITEMELLV